MSFLSKLQWNIHSLKFTIFTIFSYSSGVSSTFSLLGQHHVQNSPPCRTVALSHASLLSVTSPAPGPHPPKAPLWVESFNICPFVTGSFHWAWCPQCSSMVWRVTEFPLFLRLSSIPWSWLIGRDPDAGKDWRQKEKRAAEDEVVGWHHWLGGHESEQTPRDGEGQGSLACCRPRGQMQADTTLWLSRSRNARPMACTYPRSVDGP